MVPSNRIFSVFLVLLLGVLACSTPGVPVSPFPTAQQDSVNTLIAQTVIAAVTQSAVANVSLLSPVPSATPTLTFTPSVTPTATFTPTITLTPTPIVPMVSVSVATNCRVGPGKVYDYRGALLVGETTEVIGRDPSGNYWYVRNPDSAGNFCWLWGRYATVTGNFSVLPVFTPPPTPTPTFTPTPSPSFVASYSGLDTCGANWWLDVKIRNNGSISFRSASITVKDKATDITLVDLSDGFVDQDGCIKTTTKDVIAPGDTYLLSAPPFAYNPTGHEVRVTVTLCSNTGQQGTCITDNFNVTP